jgi:hypothetical protein
VGTIRIEPEAPLKESSCEACGGTNRLVHGYVYDDGHPHGVYFVEWCDGDHPHRAAFITLGLGAFGEGTGSADRSAFCLEWRAEGMRLTDEPARDSPELLGPFVPRTEALELEDFDDLWHVADHICSTMRDSLPCGSGWRRPVASGRPLRGPGGLRKVRPAATTSEP